MSMPFQNRCVAAQHEALDRHGIAGSGLRRARFDTFWAAEAYPWWRIHSMEARSSTAVTAIVARGTKKSIHIGWGIISPYTRHPCKSPGGSRPSEARVKTVFLLGLALPKIFMKEMARAKRKRGGSCN